MALSEWQQLAWGSAAAGGAMLALWVVAWRMQNAGVVDAAWAALVGALAIFFAMSAGDGSMERRVLLAGLAGAWSFRLANYLLTDRVLGKPEDGRYQAMRRSAGQWAEGVFLVWFLLQAGFAVIFATPMLAAARNSTPFGAPADVLAVLVWLTAVVGEGVADSQLAKFRSDASNKGKTCRVGLWRWSRHPNYFFEWLHWWTYVLLAWGVGNLWWAALACGPALMLLFLWYVTGIPYTEMQALQHRPDYAEYRRDTSAFFPWFPKRNETHR